jgi:uncharacterized protein (TIGR00251 family)
VAEPDRSPYRTTDDGLVVEVHVQPRAGRRGLHGRHGDALKVRVQAPPLDGRANEETAAVLADALGVAPGAVTLVQGGRSRWKRFAVRGDGAVLAARLDTLLAQDSRPQ